MAKTKSAKEPLRRAPAGAPSSSTTVSRGDVVEHRTPHARPVGEVLERLQAQAKDAMPDVFFDDGATTETTPLMKRMRAEVGTARVTAKRRDSNLQASVGIEVRCDRDEESDAGQYKVRAGGHVTCESKDGAVEAEIPVSTEVNDDGGLTLNSREMRQDIARTIRSTDDSFKRRPRQ
jgi:hypothetical protein